MTRSRGWSGRAGDGRLRLYRQLHRPPSARRRAPAGRATTASIPAIAGRAQEAALVVGDLADRALLQAVLAEHRFAAVIHCAAHIWVGESVREPGALLRQQHRQRDPAVRPVRQGRRTRSRVLLDRRGLRPARGGAARRAPAAGADQPLRRLEDDERAGARRHRRRHRPALRHPALLQRRRRRCGRRGSARPRPTTRT